MCVKKNLTVNFKNLTGCIQRFMNWVESNLADKTELGRTAQNERPCRQKGAGTRKLY